MGVGRLPESLPSLPVELAASLIQMWVERGLGALWLTHFGGKPHLTPPLDSNGPYSLPLQQAHGEICNRAANGG